MSFTPASLLTQLMQFPVPRRYCVAFSGGVDSHVLLHALVQCRELLPCRELHAIHINHHLHRESAQWVHHCAAVSHALGVSFESVNIQLQRQSKHSLEAMARDARYAAFEQQMQSHDMLLLAHHQDDQAETLLLQLLRGSGVKGLAGMPTCVPFANGWLARPLLSYGRDALKVYAHNEQLAWIEDPSNQDTGFDRNYLRHKIMPMLHERWPAAAATLSRAAEHQAEAAELLEVLAQQDLALLQTPAPGMMSIAPLLTLSPMRQRNVLRYWLHRVCALPLPDRVTLQRILDELLPAAEDAMPIVHWPGAEIRRYRQHLYAMAPKPAVDANWYRHWDLRGNLALPDGSVLTVRQGEGIGLRQTALGRGVMVRFRHGGERCRLPGRTHRHELKKLLQDWGVPPWERAAIPLIYIGDDIAQVSEYCVCAPYAANADEMGLQIIVKPSASPIETTRKNKDNNPGCTP